VSKHGYPCVHGTLLDAALVLTRLLSLDPPMSSV
jgi:hypothetical protein